ncbi:MAG: hypothetical protein AMXMBFR7_13860 [Planctomycetota bacterium]
MNPNSNLVHTVELGPPMGAKPKDPDEPLGRSERWALAAPLILFLVVFTSFCWAVREVDQLSRELELAAFPLISQRVFEYMWLLGEYPALITGCIFAAFWVQLGWASRKRRRARALAILMSLLTLAAIGVITFALLLALMPLMETVGS